MITGKFQVQQCPSEPSTRCSFIKNLLSRRFFILIIVSLIIVMLFLMYRFHLGETSDHSQDHMSNETGNDKEITQAILYNVSDFVELELNNDSLIINFNSSELVFEMDFTTTVTTEEPTTHESLDSAKSKLIDELVAEKSVIQFTSEKRKSESEK